MMSASGCASREFRGDLRRPSNFPTVAREASRRPAQNREFTKELAPDEVGRPVESGGDNADANSCAENRGVRFRRARDFNQRRLDGVLPTS